jgi:hypothetical protein
MSGKGRGGSSSGACRKGGWGGARRGMGAWRRAGRRRGDAGPGSGAKAQAADAQGLCGGVPGCARAGPIYLPTNTYIPTYLYYTQYTLKSSSKVTPSNNLWCHAAKGQHFEGGSSSQKQNWFLVSMGGHISSHLQADGWCRSDQRSPGIAHPRLALLDPTMISRPPSLHPETQI